ncbi:MAG: inner rane transporter RhtA, partial [Pseudonocardiales bacterium]|nr:inner rane transporter RhtA [Pseudonocardiales bacterium]
MIRTTDEPVRPGRTARTVARLPPTSFFLISSLFHYLGPSLAVLLFARVDVLGVAWLRIASAAVVFALWRRPWRILAGAGGAQRSVFVGLGVVLAAMNSLFYLAVDRLPLATVGAIEFLGIVVLAAGGARTKRNVLALVIAVAGVAVLTDVRLSGQTLGFVFAFANCAGFMLYVVLGHRIASIPASGEVPGDGAGRAASMSGIDQLGLSMLVAAVVATPFTVGAAGARTRRNVLALAIAVAGVAVLTDVRLSGELEGFVFAFGNCAGFMLYVILGHRIASIPTNRDGGSRGP